MEQTIDAKRFKDQIYPFMDKYGHIRMTINALNIALERSAKTGQWETNKTGMQYICTACGETVYYKKKYCPNCGARMEGYDG